MMAIGTDSRFVKNCVTFVDNTWHALLTDLLGNSDTVVWFGKIFAKKTSQEICEVFLYIYIYIYIYIYTHENAKILQFPNF